VRRAGYRVVLSGDVLDTVEIRKSAKAAAAGRLHCRICCFSRCGMRPWPASSGWGSSDAVRRGAAGKSAWAPEAESSRSAPPARFQ
jgi:hypothetical protein